MPYRFNEPRRHRIPRARYQVQNWPEYDRALQQRGSVTVWVTPEALAAWQPPSTGQRGRPREYSDVAIETGHLLRLAFGWPWRQTEGLLRSIAVLLGLTVGVPDHTTFARRSPGLALAVALTQAQVRGGPVVDACAKHGHDGTRQQVSAHTRRYQPDTAAGGGHSRPSTLTTNMRISDAAPSQGGNYGWTVSRRRRITPDARSTEPRRARLAGSGTGNSSLRISPPGLFTVWMLK